MLRATAAARLLLLAATACGQPACGGAPVGSSARPAALVQRPDFEEFHKLRGQWRGMEVDGTTEWTISFDDTYMVVARAANGEWYQGMAGLHYELGAAPDGIIRVPPGSGVFDVDVFGSFPPEHNGQTSLGAFYLTSPTQLKMCTSRPGVHVRALSYDVSSPSVRCFRLTRISDHPVAAELLPVEMEDTRRK